MAYSDRIIGPVLLDLSRQYGFITLTQVAEQTEIPFETVKKSVSRMVKQKQISRTGKGRKYGYRYFVPEPKGKA